MAEGDVHTLTEELYKVIYDASAKKLLNFGGHYGLYGAEKPVAEQLQKATVEFIRTVRHDNNVNQQALEHYFGQLQNARVMNILSDSDLDKIDQIIHKLEAALQ